MKVKVNSDNCIGCGACAAICGNVFELNDEGISTVINNEVSDNDKDDVKEAIESCPTSAIEEE